MKIRVQIRSVYGVENVYPVCDNAQCFARIARTKTLTVDTLAQIKALGYAIENVPVTSNLHRLISSPST